MKCYVLQIFLEYFKIEMFLDILYEYSLNEFFRGYFETDSLYKQFIFFPSLNEKYLFFALMWFQRFLHNTPVGKRPCTQWNHPIVYQYYDLVEIMNLSTKDDVCPGQVLAEMHARALGFGCLLLLVKYHHAEIYSFFTI